MADPKRNPRLEGVRLVPGTTDRYDVTWWDKQGAHKKRVTGIRAAESLKVEKERDKQQGRDAFSDGKLTVRQYGERWLERQSFARDGTGVNTEHCLNRLFNYPPVGDARLSEVEASHIEGWHKWLKATYKSSHTCRVTWVKVCALFRAAVHDKKIMSSPCEGVVLHLAAVPPIVVPTVEEVNMVHAQLPARWRDAIFVGALTGLRPGELLGLCEEQVVLGADPHLVVDRQLKGSKVVPYTKTSNSDSRSVPLSPHVVSILMVHLAMNPPDASGRLFPVVVGNKTWPKAVARAGIKRQLRMHDLRHFFASHMLRESRGDWVYVADCMGDRVATVQKTYAHLVKVDRHDVLVALDRLFATDATPTRLS